MNYELKIFGCLCSTKLFVINGIIADSDDFGNQDDENSEEADDYACGNMVFKPKDATDEVLDKYKITNDEYNDIAEELEEKLSFGSCGLCV